MAERHDERNGLFWSLISWGAALVAALVVGYVVAVVFGGRAPAGLVFGGVTFIVLAWLLSRLLGPPAEDDAPHLPAAAGHAHGGHAAPVTRAAPAAPAVPVAAPVRAPAAPPPDPAAGAISERVREAARAAGEAARAAVGDVASAAAGRPAAFSAPLEGEPDNLMRLKGVGPKFAEMLNAQGIFYFRQIAAWGPGEIEWIEAKVEGFSGRVLRDDWVGQAKVLAAGGETEHSQRVDRGEST